MSTLAEWSFRRSESFGIAPQHANGGQVSSAVLGYGRQSGRDVAGGDAGVGQPLRHFDRSRAWPATHLERPEGSAGRGLSGG